MVLNNTLDDELSFVDEIIELWDVAQHYAVCGAHHVCCSLTDEDSAYRNETFTLTCIFLSVTCASQVYTYIHTYVIGKKSSLGRFSLYLDDTYKY